MEKIQNFIESRRGVYVDSVSGEIGFGCDFNRTEKISPKFLSGIWESHGISYSPEFENRWIQWMRDNEPPPEPKNTSQLTDWFAILEWPEINPEMPFFLLADGHHIGCFESYAAAVDYIARYCQATM